MPSSEEFEYIKQLIHQSKPTTTAEVRTTLNTYFDTVVFSLLQEEWNAHMNEDEREGLCAKLLQSQHGRQHDRSIPDA